MEIIAAVPEEHKASLMPQLKVCAPNEAADCSLFFLCVLPTILKKPRPPSLMPQLKVCAPNEAADCFLFFLCVLPTILKTSRPPSLMPQLKVCAPGKPARFSFLCVQCNTFKASRPPSSCSFCVHIFTRLARTIYLRCINSIFGREITKYTVIRCIYTVLANPTYSLGPLLPQYTQSVRTANAADIAPTRDGAICTLFATPASQLPLAIATSLQLY